jgi:hypothetical protein
VLGTPPPSFEKNEFPCADFHETRRYSTAIFVDLLHRILPKYENKFGKYGQQFNEIMQCVLKFKYISFLPKHRTRVSSGAVMCVCICKCKSFEG